MRPILAAMMILALAGFGLVITGCKQAPTTQVYYPATQGGKQIDVYLKFPSSRPYKNLGSYTTTSGPAMDPSAEALLNQLQAWAVAQGADAMVVSFVQPGEVGKDGQVVKRGRAGATAIRYLDKSK